MFRQYLYWEKNSSMGATIIEKILATHSGKESVAPGEIVDITIDARAARDFGGANVVKHIRDNGLSVDDPNKTLFTFDCNPTGSDQKYAANQHLCRIFAREHNIRVHDIDQGIGTHILMEEGLAYSGTTAVSTDSHANILGAVGAFGQGMGDRDIAAAWSKGKTWFKVPHSVKITLNGTPDAKITAKDIVLNLLAIFGSNTLLGYAIELYGDFVDQMKLDDRITIASMATELGAIIILFPPSDEIISYSEARARKRINPVLADDDASYLREEILDLSTFSKLVSLPGKPHATSNVPSERVWIDSAFIGSCTNGRLKDLQMAACILKGRKIAPHVVLKVVPATNKVWEQALEAGYIEDLKEAGALISNAGCAGCAAGQVGQNGPGEVTISTGNRNFPGKQGQGEVYLASPDVVAASAIAGYITTPENIPETIQERIFSGTKPNIQKEHSERKPDTRPTIFTGNAWVIEKDDIDTDMIFHNRYLSITDTAEMGQYAFDNLEGYEDFASKVKEGDIIITGKNFGAGSSRQQAVDCFKTLGVAAIVAASFGAIYERNAINAAFPILTGGNDLLKAGIVTGDRVELDISEGTLKVPDKSMEIQVTPFSEVQLEIYNQNGLF